MILAKKPAEFDEDRADFENQFPLNQMNPNHHNRFLHQKSGRAGNAFWVILILLLLLPVFKIRSEEPEKQDDQTKAAFLFHFTQFVRWPDQSETSENRPIRIALLDSDEIASILEKTVKDKSSGGRRVEIVRCATIAEAKGAELFFIPGQDRSLQEGAISAWGNSSVLLVGETRDFIKLGGMIALVREQEQLKIILNRKAFERAGLSASSRLLRLVEMEAEEK